MGLPYRRAVQGYEGTAQFERVLGILRAVRSTAPSLYRRTVRRCRSPRRLGEAVPPRERFRSLQDRVLSRRATGRAADKAFWRRTQREGKVFVDASALRSEELLM